MENQDNELLVLEVLHRYVELLDKYFGNVSIKHCFGPKRMEKLQYLVLFRILLLTAEGVRTIRLLPLCMCVSVWFLLSFLGHLKCNQSGLKAVNVRWCLKLAVE